MSANVIVTSMKPSDEPKDEQVYSLVSIYSDTFRFLLAGLRFYRDLLRRDREAISLDSELKELLGTELAESSVLERELKRVDRAIAWWEKIETEQGKEEFSY